MSAIELRRQQAVDAVRAENERRQQKISEIREEIQNIELDLETGRLSSEEMVELECFKERAKALEAEIEVLTEQQGSSMGADVAPGISAEEINAEIVKKNELLMLSHLTLSPKHHNDLLSRGLSEERISQNMYRSLPSGTSARRLLAGMLSDFHDLEGIPGFSVDKDGCWNISGHSGLLVPYCTMDGYIQGLQVRLDDEKNPERKYRWLASRGRPHGVRCPAWIHVTGNPSATTAYLTEGGLKGDVASFLDDDALFL